VSATAAKYGDAYIAGLDGLEPGLGVVPGVDPRDPRAREPDAEWRLRWFAWRKRVAKLRAEVQLAALTDATVRAAQHKLCEADWAYLMTMYGWTYDPRIREGEDPDKPFILFAAQANKIAEFQRVCASPRKIDIFDSKARGIGWTDTYAGAAVGAWLFTDWSIHFVSFKEDKVYRRNDRGSIFGKIEYKLERLPEWLLPEGFFVEDHMLRLNLYNPATGAAITGESTTSRTARGDRKTAIVYDECAFIENFTDVFGVGAGTTNHRFGLSTESYQEGDDWERLWTTEKREGDPARVWEVDWWHNPYQDTAWFAEEQGRWKHDPTGFAREYLRDAEAAEAGWIYPEVKHCRKTEAHFDPTKSLIVAIDPGHADDTGIVWGQKIAIEGRTGIRWLGSYKRNRVPVDFYAHLLTGIRPEPQDACWGMWTDGGFSERDRRLMAWFAERQDRVRGLEEWVRFCMDPAGAQEHAGSSFIDLFHKKTAELRQRQWAKDGSHGPKPKGIYPNYRFLHGNLVVDRVLITRRFLPATEFSTADPELWRAEDIQDALRRSRYSESTPRSVSQPKPIHGEESHLRSAVEYASYYLETGGIELPPGKRRRMLDALKRAA
jgi:hypothetical protein